MTGPYIWPVVLESLNWPILRLTSFTVCPRLVAIVMNPTHTLSYFYNNHIEEAAAGTTAGEHDRDSPRRLSTKSQMLSKLKQTHSRRPRLNNEPPGIRIPKSKNVAAWHPPDATPRNPKQTPAPQHACNCLHARGAASASPPQVPQGCGNPNTTSAQLCRAKPAHPAHGQTGCRWMFMIACRMVAGSRALLCVTRCCQGSTNQGLRLH